MKRIKFLLQIDKYLLPILFCMMGISLLVIFSTTKGVDGSLASSLVCQQLSWFALGGGFFVLGVLVDYRFWYRISSFIYIVMIVLLFGLFVMPSVQNVHRWYRFGPLALQPSEGAKIIVVLVLSVALDRWRKGLDSWKRTLQLGAMVFVPCLLILRQPDLGTTVVIALVSLLQFYFAGVRPILLRFFGYAALFSVTLLSLVFLKIVPFTFFKPIATMFIKEYQYERFNPEGYHREAAQTAISLGGVWGVGWGNGEFTSYSWLPAAHTDSVFPAFIEEFGLLGGGFVMLLCFGLVFLSIRTSYVVQDFFGQMLALGVGSYFAVHILLNLGMMSGFLPITGVPLLLISYGGSSVMVAMFALGLLQSIYSRRFMF